MSSSNIWSWSSRGSWDQKAMVKAGLQVRRLWGAIHSEKRPSLYTGLFSAFSARGPVTWSARVFRAYLPWPGTAFLEFDCQKRMSRLYFTPCAPLFRFMARGHGVSELSL